MGGQVWSPLGFVGVGVRGFWPANRQQDFVFTILRAHNRTIPLRKLTGSDCLLKVNQESIAYDENASRKLSLRRYHLRDQRCPYWSN